MKTSSAKAVMTIIAMTAFSIILSAQNSLHGTWHGALSIPGGELTIVLHIDQSGCAMDSPDQGAYGIPAEMKELTDSKVSVEVPSIGAGFEGNLMFGLLVGRFRQSGMEFPMSLKRGEPVRNRPQTPTGPFPYTCEDITFTNPEDGAVLSGTLITPDGYGSHTPIVLFVTGSGIQNRDEELFGHKPFLVIADHLARNGIASLRYDDRSCGKSTGDVSMATTDTFMKDAAAGIDFIRSLNRYGKVGIIGHSEGGTIAFMLAGEGKADFIVSLAGTAVNGIEILVEQNRRILSGSEIPEAIVNDYCTALQKTFAYRTTDYLNGNETDADPEKTVNTILSISGIQLPEGLSANLVEVVRTINPWMMRFLILDPAGWIRKITCPVMALNGEKDVQVIAGANLSRLNELLPESGSHFIRSYPDLNHLFQHCSTGMPDEYGKIEETVSEEVLSDITYWITTL